MSHDIILFLTLLVLFSYEDKRLAQDWTTHNRCTQWPVWAGLSMDVCAKSRYFKQVVN